MIACLISAAFSTAAKRAMKCLPASSADRSPSEFGTLPTASPALHKALWKALCNAHHKKFPRIHLKYAGFGRHPRKTRSNRDTYSTYGRPSGWAETLFSGSLDLSYALRALSPSHPTHLRCIEREQTGFPLQTIFALNQSIGLDSALGRHFRAGTRCQSRNRRPVTSERAAPEGTDNGDTSHAHPCDHQRTDVAPFVQ